MTGGDDAVVIDGPARAEDRASDTLRQLGRTIDARLDVLLTDHRTAPAVLVAAMRHAVLAPGKRVRPLLTMLVASHFSGRHAAALDTACAMEMVHTASLVLDDLPAMDDARLRRGIPATHVAFGEGTAILVAIALLNRAYGLVADAPISADARLAIVAMLARTVGIEGLSGGQHADLNERAAADRHAVAAVSHRKTGVLFVACIEAGARIAGLEGAALAGLRTFGEEFGLAFQTLDDVTDRVASQASAGKDTGKDADKPTLVSLLGLEAARAAANLHAERACAALAPYGAPGEALARQVGAWIAGGFR